MRGVSRGGIINSPIHMMFVKYVKQAADVYELVSNCIVPRESAPMACDKARIASFVSTPPIASRPTPTQ